MKPFDLEAGSRDFYADSGYYDYEFRRRRADIAWYTELYLQADGAVLELGVGSGRTALRAVRQGAQVLGLDLSWPMLAAARVHRDRLPKARRANLRLVRSDMRAFAFDTKFGVISSPFNAFQHLYTREDVERCLACVRAHLEPDGLFLLDVLLPDLDYLVRSPFKRHPGTSFTHPSFQAQYTYSERSAYDPVCQTNQMWFHYDLTDEAPPPGAPQHYCVQLSHRCFFPAELQALLHYNGFECLALYGDFEQGELRADSESQVLVCGLAS